MENFGNVTTQSNPSESMVLLSDIRQYLSRIEVILNPVLKQDLGSDMLKKGVNNSGVLVNDLIEIKDILLCLEKRISI